MRGILFLSKEVYPQDYDIMMARLAYDYMITVEFNINKSFKEVVIPTQDFLDSLDLLKDMSINVFGDELFGNALKEYEGKENELLENVEFIHFTDIDFSDILNYLEANKELQNKKIVLNVVDEEIDFVKDNFSNYLSNIYFMVPGNDEYVSFSDYLRAVAIIDNYVNEIKSFDFSPLEAIMYAYDIVRNRVYHFEDSGESYVVSRDLISALLGDKIVCVGYANIFKAILDNLNIESHISMLDGINNKNGHARNVVRVIDPKYNIDGIYYFDTTYDSKKSENDINYLYGYRFFALTKKEIDFMDKDRLIDEKLPRFSFNIDEELIRIVDKYGQGAIPTDLMKTINNMSKLTNGELLIDAKILMNIPAYPLDLDDTVEKIRNVIKIFDVDRLPAEVLCEVLYNVRKNQFYNYDEYPFGIDPIYNVVLNSKWKFKQTAEEKLLNALGIEYKVPLEEKMIKYIKQNDLQRKVENINLAKVLRKVYEKKDL